MVGASREVITVAEAIEEEVLGEAAEDGEGAEGEGHDDEQLGSSLGACYQSSYCTLYIHQSGKGAFGAVKLAARTNELLC